jgi:hypothetical protein
MRMMPHHHARPRLKHLVRHVHIFRPRRRRVLDPPVNRHHQKIALRPRLLHRRQHRRLIGPRRPAALARIRKEVHMRLVVLVRIPVPIQPPRHPQPAHLDPVRLGNHRLPLLLDRIARPRKQQPSAFRCSRVSVNPAHPWSMTWLFAKLTILIPLAFSPSSSATGASNMKGLLPFECSGATGVSRFTNPKSARSKTSATSENSAPPPLRIGRISRLQCILRRRPHRLMRNHVPRHGKLHLSQIVRIRRNHRRQPMRPTRHPAHAPQPSTTPCSAAAFHNPHRPRRFAIPSHLHPATQRPRPTLRGPPVLRPARPIHCLRQAVLLRAPILSTHKSIHADSKQHTRL